MNKERFIKMLKLAKEDENGNLYFYGDYHNKIYFGTITTICDDLVDEFCDKEKEGYELYDSHFIGDDTLVCKIVNVKEEIK